MVAYSFKPRFAKPILLGLGGAVTFGPDEDPLMSPKRQTIRATGRRRHARPGETLQLYTGMRTRQCRKIGEARCVSVRPIVIRVHESRIEIDRSVRYTSKRDLNQFAREDGFSDWESMRQFWLEEHRDVDVFQGVIIRWEPLT